MLKRLFKRRKDDLTADGDEEYQAWLKGQVVSKEGEVKVAEYNRQIIEYKARMANSMSAAAAMSAINASHNPER